MIKNKLSKWIHENPYDKKQIEDRAEFVYFTIPFSIIVILFLLMIYL